MIYILQWAKKLQPQRLSELYKKYGGGIQDEELLNDVGAQLYLRCEAIVMVSRNMYFCAACGRKNAFPEAAANDAVCAACSLTCTREEFARSVRHRDLRPGNAGEYFLHFYKKYPAAHSFGQKMVLIDTLIHSFHIDAKFNVPNRAAANNLIEGSLQQVVNLLDGLSGVQPDNDAAFKSTAELMWKRRRGMLDIKNKCR